VGTIWIIFGSEFHKMCKREVYNIYKFLNFYTLLIFEQQEEIMTLERIILKTIKFNLQVEHPHTFILKYAKCLKGDKDRLQMMVQIAWRLANDW
jgi:hypothetical protein